jgi:hypothetical protein
MDTWKKFAHSIKQDGIKDYVILKITKQNGINQFTVEDGNHRIYALRKLGLQDAKVPVLFQICTSIPMEELMEIFYMLSKAKIIDTRDFSSIMDQMVIMQISEVRMPDLSHLISEKREVKRAYEHFRGSKLFDFFDSIFSGSYKAYNHTEGFSVK